MFTAIISDLHLNPRKIDPTIITFLKEIYASPNIKDVIFNGDFVELFGPPWFRGQKRFDCFYKNWESSLKPLFDTKPTTLIFGNHDKETFYSPRLKNLLPKTASFVNLMAGDTDFHITHGHQYVLKGEIIYPIGFAIGSFIKILYKIFSFEKINTFFGKNLNRQAKAQAPKRKSLIIGHTHFFEIDPFSKFYNSGCNLNRHTQGLALDLNTGRVCPISTAL